MQTLSAYYQPSGRTPPIGGLVVLVGGIVAAVPLSVIYVLAVRYLPAVQLSVLLAIGFGFGIGFLTAKLVAFGKLRSPLVAGLLGLIVGLAATWLQCGFFAAFVLHGDNAPLVSLYVHFLTRPDFLWSSLSYISAHGTWTLGSNGGDPVKGVFLVIIWMVEALIITAPVMVLASRQAAKPFSETMQRWAAKARLPGRLPFFPNPKEVRARLENGDLMPLVTNEKPSLVEFARLDLYSAEGDPTCFFLSVENVREYLNKKKKKETRTTSIVKYLHLPAELAKQLQQLHSTPLSPT